MHVCLFTMYLLPPELDPCRLASVLVLNRTPITKWVKLFPVFEIFLYLSVHVCITFSPPSTHNINALVKHNQEIHGGNKQSYTARLISQERGLLHLSVKEALLLESQLAGTSMNDRLEMGRGTGIIRIRASN